jgi:hypothetical protein
MQSVVEGNVLWPVTGYRVVFEFVNSKASS